jgi:hypothetical protein
MASHASEVWSHHADPWSTAVVLHQRGLESPHCLQIITQHSWLSLLALEDADDLTEVPFGPLELLPLLDRKRRQARSQSDQSIAVLLTF